MPRSESVRATARTGAKKPTRLPEEDPYECGPGGQGKGLAAGMHGILEERHRKTRGLTETVWEKSGDSAPGIALALVCAWWLGLLGRFSASKNRREAWSPHWDILAANAASPPHPCH